MSEQLETYEAQPIDIIRQPADAINEAKRAAVALAAVVAGKKKPVIFNGEQYLEFEDWQTVGNFYGLTAKITSTMYIEYGTVRGFEARAVTLNRYGVEISAAESMCLNDEPNWKNKPLFQLKSMAQTRAAAKALRNVLAWVVVLAGYKTTPAEEMDKGTEKELIKPPTSKVNDPEAPITEPQLKAISTLISKIKVADNTKHAYVANILNIDPPNSMKDLNKGQASVLIEELGKRV